MSENDRILWHAKIKKYDQDLYKLICYPDKSKKQKWPDLFKPINIPKPLKFLKSVESLSRTKTKIFEYMYCNDFDYFLTLTLNPNKHNPQDLKSYISKLSRFLRYYRSQYNANIQYLLIPEQHKSGAWHMHGAIKNISKDKMIINNNGYLDWPDYQARFGFISLSPIKSKIAASRYITKYVTKTLLQNKNQKTYYCSRGLKTAEEVFNQFGYEDQQEFAKYFFRIKYDFSNDYCRVKYLDQEFYNILFDDKVKHQKRINDQIDQDLALFDYLDV